MCIIATKNKGVNTINWDNLKNCFENNNDGAGYMYTSPKTKNVIIKKGFMLWANFEKSLKADIAKNGLKNMSIVAHFRITTHGLPSAQNTHPYIISNNLKDLEALRITGNMGVCMNGIVDIKLPHKSSHNDTMEYIKTYLFTLQALKRDFLIPPVVELIDKSGAKWTFLDSTGKITNIGTFTNSEQWDYSNYTYEDYSYYGYYGKNSKYGKIWNWDDYDKKWKYNDDETKGDIKAISGAKTEKMIELLEGYIVTAAGEYIEIGFDYPDGVYIDIENKIYAYDYTMDKLKYIEGVAYTFSSGLITYDKAVEMGW